MDATSIYSCDDHIDLGNVAPDLWEARLPKAVGGARSTRRDGRRGYSRWVVDNQVVSFPLPSGDDEAATTPLIRRPVSKLWIRDGIWASVIYGPVPLHMSIADPEIEQALSPVWNDWAAEEFNGDSPRSALRPAVLCPPRRPKRRRPN